MRKHRSNYRKLSKKVKRRIILGIIGALLLAFLIFWGLFYITDVEVVGNTRYTEEEVEDMALQGFFGHNSLLLSTFQSHIALNDIPFMESVDVEYLDRNSVRLHVNEKQPIGYVQKDGTDYYFDKDGLVLEALTSESASGGESGNAGTAADSSAFSSAFSSGQETQSQSGQEAISADSAGTGDTSGNAEGSTSDTSSASDAGGVLSADPVTTESQETDSESETSSDSGYRPALTDVPLITGLSFDSVAVGEILPVADTSFFNTILALTRMIDRYDIQPDYVEFAEDQSMTLYYGNVKIALGTDQELEEKMTRVAAILPKLDGMAGTLHLEDYTEETQNIIFDTES